MDGSCQIYLGKQAGRCRDTPPWHLYPLVEWASKIPLVGLNWLPSQLPSSMATHVLPCQSFISPPN